MKDFDLFESYKGSTKYPLVAEIKTMNSGPVFTYDKHGLFENLKLEEGVLKLYWKTRSVDIEYGYLHGIFFTNGVLIEEHHLSLPPPRHEDQYFWWSHNYIEQLMKGLNVKFYGR